MDTTPDTAVGGAAVEGRVNEGADTGAERRGGDGVILRRFGALSPSPPIISSSLPRLSSRGLFATTTGVVGATARSSPSTIDGVGAAGEGGTDVDEDGKGGGRSGRGGGASTG